jgi:hypothetical protein
VISGDDLVRETGSTWDREIVGKRNEKGKKEKRKRRKRLNQVIIICITKIIGNAGRAEKSVAVRGRAKIVKKIG